MWGGEWGGGGGASEDTQSIERSDSKIRGRGFETSADQLMAVARTGPIQPGPSICDHNMFALWPVAK